MEDQIGDFPGGGVLIPGHLKISRGFPRGGFDPWASKNIRRISQRGVLIPGHLKISRGFPRWGVLIPGHLRISRGFPHGGWSLGYRPGAFISSSKFDFPTSSLRSLLT